MDKEIAKSSAVIQKEVLLEELNKKRKKLQTQLKRNRTMLSNLKEEIKEMGLNSINGMRRMADIVKLTDEISGIIQKIKKSKKISKKDKLFVEDLKDELRFFKQEMGFFEEMEEELDMTNFDPADHINEDEYGRKIEMDMFADFKVEMGKEEKKNFRKLFLQLANQVHPDRAKTDIQRALFHQYMLRLNNAKQIGDYEALLKIQQELTELDSQAIPEDFEMPFTDLLDDKISLVKIEIDGINSQLGRIKEELSDLRSSDLGMMNKEDRRSKKWGQSSDEMHQQGNVIFEQFTTLKEALENWLQTSKKPQYIVDMENGEGELFGMDDDEFDEDDFDTDDILQFIVDLSNQNEPKKRKRR